MSKDTPEITRPIQEATEADVGKLCCFWDYENSGKHYGLLTKVILTEVKGKYYELENCSKYNHCRRLTKQEIEELI